MKSNNVTISILAHVDAGKTTLSEGLLYLSGSIRTMGRVDHGDTLFDSYAQERTRGITIFSKCARMQLDAKTAFLLDTPGHVDFSAETERAAAVSDYAILVISGADGLQSHTHTLFSLLKRYHVPVFLFVNKMDQPGTDRELLMHQLKSELDVHCVDCSGWQKRLDDREEHFLEELADCSDDLLEQYLNGGEIREQDLARLTAKQHLFPCFFGSALKMEQVDELYLALCRLTLAPERPDDFGAAVYKISRDERGARLTWMKITGGMLHVRDTLTTGDQNEKINQIRCYSGTKYELLQEAQAGMVCAVTGPEKIQIGQGLGQEPDMEPVLVPVMSYALIPREGIDSYQLFLQLKELAEEEPELSLVWDEQRQEIEVRLMGEVQVEVLQQLIRERCHVDVQFGNATVIYQETVAEPVIGTGHFEPIRHYAQVSVRIEPGEPGSGIELADECPEDALDPLWKKNILMHLRDHVHVGVLTGSQLTDVKITLVDGKFHRAHSQGSDFREAALRAVRQGLMKAKCVLLEPFYSFSLQVPDQLTGRAMTELQSRGAVFDPPEILDGFARLNGSVPVRKMQGFERDMISFTAGKGQLMCRFDSFRPCEDQQEVVDEIGYDPDADTKHPSSSLFFHHGSAVYVPWDEVDQYAGIRENDSVRDSALDEAEAQNRQRRQAAEHGQSTSPGGAFSGFSPKTDEDRELEAIFARTYGTKKEGKILRPRTVSVPKTIEKSAEVQQESYLLVDGYNIIFAWSGLNELSEINLDSAREQLMDIMCNYQGYRGGHLILVFDAYKVRGGVEKVLHYHNIDVVYTREAETADAYIERVTKKIADRYDVTVATSDGLEQMIIWGHGARRMSAAELKTAVEEADIELRRFMEAQTGPRGYLFDSLTKQDRQTLERIRLGKKLTKKSIAGSDAEDSSAQKK